MRPTVPIACKMLSTLGFDPHALVGWVEGQAVFFALEMFMPAVASVLFDEHGPLRVSWLEPVEGKPEAFRTILHERTAGAEVRARQILEELAR